MFTMDQTLPALKFANAIDLNPSTGSCGIPVAIASASSEVCAASFLVGLEQSQ